MTGATLSYGPAALLAMALLYATWTDIRRRQIDNWLNGALMLTAPLAWWSLGYALWPDVAIQLGIASAVFAVFLGLFAIGAMGGGDVKLITALALWLPWRQFSEMLILMALIGGMLTIMVVAWHTMRRQPGRPKIPYGVAIAVAGLWVVGTPYLNQFA